MPSYPNLPLEEAIDKARVVFTHSRQNPVPSEVAFKYWKYSPTSSGARAALAAVKQYGLLESVGNKRSGEVRVSDLAKSIILDSREHSPERDRAIKEAAIKPEIYNDMWQHWGVNTPDDATMATYLTLTKGFHDTTVKGLIEDYKKTMAFARLAVSGSMTPKPEDDPPPVLPKAGDYVQWTTSSGTDMFLTPQKIISIDDSGEYAFFECTKTGVPMNELAVMEPPQGEKQKPPRGAAPANPFFVPSKPSGPMISYPFGKNNNMELRLDARLSKKDFERLKSLIELSEDSLVLEGEAE